MFESKIETFQVNKISNHDAQLIALEYDSEQILQSNKIV